MNHEKIQKFIFWFYFVLAGCMLVFLMYLGGHQNQKVFENRSNQGLWTLEDVKYQELEDTDAPIGIKKEYTINIGEMKGDNNYLSFYLVHHYARVYLEDELVFSLLPEEGSKVSKSAGCTWCMVPLYADDAGKTIRVELMPSYKGVRERETEFYFGSRYTLFAETLKGDMWEILLSGFAIMIGIGFIAIAAVCLLQKRKQGNLLFLGLFSMALGLWRVTDTRTLAMLFADRTLLLSQTSLAMLSLGVIPFNLFIEKQVDRKRCRLLDWVCVLSAVTSMIQLLLQVTGILDLRETMTVSHVVIVLTAVAVTQAIIGQWRETKSDRRAGITLLCLMLCVVGIIVDLIYYYITGISAGLMITIAIFVVYIMIMGVMEIQEMNHQANIDFSTGLFNRSRCREMVLNTSQISENTCLFMFDLNGLKKVNDTMGHKAGDEMIYRFAETLRQNVPASAFLGRYGGDEFIVIMKKCDRKLAEKIAADVAASADEYNKTDCKVKLSYSVGYALSSEYPDCTMPLLLEKADEKMYGDKKEYYRLLKNHM